MPYWVVFTPLHIDPSVLGKDPANAIALLGGLLDSAMDAIITIDAGQKIVLFNRAAEKVFGHPRDKILGQPLEKLIPQRFRAGHAEQVHRFGTTGVTSRRMGSTTVLYGLRANGEEFPIDASISQLETPVGKLFTVILRDVTLRLQAEERHARLVRRLSGLLDSAMDGIITMDEDQRIVLYNRAAEKIFGWSAEEAIGQKLTKLMPERFKGHHREFVERFAQTGVTSRKMGADNVIYGRRSDGEEFPMDASISQLDTLDGKLFTVILRDVTERVRAQEERAAFASAVQEVREEEKARVARELHDELAQSLTALKMDTLWVRDNGTSDAAGAQEKLADMLAMLDRAVASTRRIAADLRPLLLDDLGLGAAIEWVASNFKQRSGIETHVAVDEMLELREPYATAVFRIVQESLANVGKHAQATEVWVAVDLGDDAIRLSVRDNGKGFSPSAPRKPQSLGLMGLRERAQLLRGSFNLDSEPGKGTLVEVHIPLTESQGR